MRGVGQFEGVGVVPSSLSVAHKHEDSNVKNQSRECNIIVN